MSAIEEWSTSPGDNNAAVPHGFPEGMQQSWFNDACREVMAAVRLWYENADFVNFLFGYTIARTGAQQITITNFGLGASYFPVGCRVRCSPTASIGNVTARNTVGPDLVVDVDFAVPDPTTGIERFIASTVRSAAFVAQGNTVGQVPVHSSTGPLLTGAYKNHGNNVADLALHAFAGPLKEGAYVDVGTAAGEVPTNSLLGAEAYLTRPRSYTRKTADYTAAFTDERAIPELTGIAVPGYTSGTKHYRLNITLQAANNAIGQKALVVRVGTAGDITDTPVAAQLYVVLTGLTYHTMVIAGLEITVAGSGVKVTVSYEGELGDQIIGTSFYPSFLEIEGIDL